MTNVSNQTTENLEKSIEKNVWNRSTLDALLKAALEKRFHKGNILNISSVNTINYTRLPSEIREIMTQLRDADPEKYPGITDAIIYDELPSPGRLKSEFLNHILGPLQHNRNRLESHILSSTDILTIIPEVGQDGSIRKHINQLTENELSEYLIHHKKLCRWIEGIYTKNSGTIKYMYPKIESLFSEAERAIFPANIQDILLNAIERQSHGDRLSQVAMRTLFRHFKDDVKKLQRIATFFHVDMSLKSLVDTGVITDTQLETIVAYIFGDDWKNELSTDEQKKVVQKLRYDDSTKIQITRDIFASINLDAMKMTLISALDDRLAQLAASQEGGPDVGDDIIMGDINPEIHNRKEIWHNVWLDKLDSLFKKRNIHNPGLQNLRKNAVYRWTDTGKGEVFTIRILEEDAHAENAIEPRLKIRFLKSGKSGISKHSGEDRFFSYADFGMFILHTGASAHIYSNDKFEDALSSDEREVKASNGEKILDVGTSEIETIERFEEELNTYIDESGKSIRLEPGMVFISKSGEEDKESMDVAYTVQSINPPYITFTNGRDVETCTFDEFITVARSQGCKRIAKITSDADFVHALGKYGVDHAELKNGKLSTETHEHDEHGHEKKVKGEYKFFESEQGGHIMMGAIDDGFVHFGEWSGTDMNVSEFRDRQKKGNKLTEKEKKNLYNWKTVSYGVFLKYLGENKMKATTTNVLGDTNADYHGHAPHMETGLFKRWMRSFSVADIIHGVKGVGHAIEHYLEKGSKLNASRSALKMARMMGLPADIIAQLQADEVGSMKEIIEKLVSKLEGQNGPVGRNKALHIVHSKGSRPEEVAAAAMYMVKGYGQLYAEDIKHAQGTESFINALIYSCGYTSDAAIDEQKRKARDKFRTDMGTEPGQPIQEEEMIWGFMKTIDGNAAENPLAGALIKAMGGPGGWERIWRTEGHKGAIEKGKRQTSDIPNAQGRLNKYFSALSTHEFNTAVSMMESVAGKSKDSSMQGAPVVWCLTGMTNYVSTKLAQEELWQFVASKGHSFHAYSFLRNKERNDNYREVFFSALEGIADPTEISNLKKAIQAVQYNGHDDPHKDRDTKIQLKNFEYINSIWRKYEGRGLHDRLQGKNSWLIEQVHTHHNKQAESYLTTISGGGHIQMSMDNAPSNDNGWLAEFGHNFNPIVKYTDNKLLSFEWHINKLKKDGSTTFALNKDMYERFWPPIVQTMKNLKRLPNEDLQKQQYLQYRKDIVDHFRRILGSFGKGEATEEVLRSVRAQPYYHDLQNMGITIDEFFTETYSTIDDIAGEDYIAWKNGGRSSRRTGNTIDVEGSVETILSYKNKPVANDPHFRQAA